MKTVALASRTVFAAVLIAALPSHAAFGDVDPAFRTAAFEGFVCRNSPTLLSNDSMLVLMYNQRDNSVVSSPPGFWNAVAKLNADGTVDRAFGQDGLATFVGPNNELNLLPLGDGRILVLGAQATRLFADGRVDPSYGQGGTTEQFFHQVRSATLLPDGSLMVASIGLPEVTFAWYTPEGRLAVDRGNAGHLSVPLEWSDRVYAWTLQADGSVEIASYPFTKGAPSATVRRITASPTGGTSVTAIAGVMPTPGIAGWTSGAVKVDAFGGVLIASGENEDYLHSNVRLTRFAPSGAIDRSFGSGGSISATTLGSEGQSAAGETPEALWATPEGGWTMVVDARRVYGAGFSSTPADDKRVLRFTAAGQLDRAFPQGIRFNLYQPLTQRDDGKLLAAHTTQPGAVPTCTVKRYLSDVSRIEATMVEYFHPALDHYFMTIEGLEVGILDDNRASMGWVRTGKRFGAWSVAPVPGTTRVCRFYGDLSAGPNSHFYIPEGAGCDGLRQLEAQRPIGSLAWRLEGIAFSTVETSAGACPGALTPVYRFYNRGYEQGRDSNHRYSTDPAVSAEMIAKGWAAEGIAFCAPPLSARQQLIFQ